VLLAVSYLVLLVLLFNAEPFKPLSGMCADFFLSRCLRSAAVYKGCADEAKDSNKGNSIGCSDCIHYSKTPSES